MLVKVFALIILSLGIYSSLSYAKVNIRNAEIKQNDNNIIIEGHVQKGDRDKYIFWANSCQEIDIQAICKGSPVNIRIIKPESKYFSRKGEYVRFVKVKNSLSWHGVLPVKGDYIIEIFSQHGLAKYNIKMSIVGKSTWKLIPRGLWEYGNICMSDNYIAWEDGHFAKYSIEENDNTSLLIKLKPGGRVKFSDNIYGNSINYIWFDKREGIHAFYYFWDNGVKNWGRPQMAGYYTEITE